MMSVLFVNIAKNHSIGCVTRLCKITRNYNVTQVAFMKRLSLKEEWPKPKPLPYWKIECDVKYFMFDLSMLRFDENSRLLVVDGPPSAGKDKLCKKLAEEFGLLYMPPPSHDDIYMDASGFDLRHLDSQLPLACESCDLKRFLREPKQKLTASFQLAYLMMRYEQYTNALLHILATGQGVILNRSVYSDSIFVDAMYNVGYISKEVAEYFDILKRNCLHILLRPHLIIYLDIPPDVTLENIKKHGTQDEINSKVFTTNYLTALDRATREKCLSWLSPHSEILIYDSNEESNHMDIVHDIECLNLEEEEHKDKFEDWVFLDIQSLQKYIVLYQDKHCLLHKMLRITDKLLPHDLGLTAEENDHLANLLESVPALRFEAGYNPLLGDTFRTAKYKYRSDPALCITRRRMRDYVNCKMFQL